MTSVDYHLFNVFVKTEEVENMKRTICNHIYTWYLIVLYRKIGYNIYRYNDKIRYNDNLTVM